MKLLSNVRLDEVSKHSLTFEVVLGQIPDYLENLNNLPISEVIVDLIDDIIEAFLLFPDIFAMISMNQPSDTFSIHLN